jgi:predicted AlkP superfamily phosphohydrolase/phosphomutase
MMSNKVAVIGLDCATPQFLFNGWKRLLPNLSRLMEGGLWGELESTLPPITVPAWTSMMTGLDPGELGFYGFRNRKNHTYDELYFANASYLRAETVWTHLGRSGRQSILLGIPQTYPPRPLKGCMVGCFLTPSKEAAYTYPPELKREIDELADGDYIIDVRDFRTNDKDRLLSQVYLMTERRFKVARGLLARKPWDFFMMVEMGTDRIHHGFWRYGDPAHRLYEPGNPYEHAIRDYYVYLDTEIGKLLELLPKDCTVLVVSDHGAKTMIGGVCINDWLIREGYLNLKAPLLSGPTKFKLDMVDWPNTTAWGEGGYYSRIFLNVQGREPQGKIPAADYQRVRDELKAKLEAIEGPGGAPIGTRAFKPEEVYRACRNIPPDLIVYLGNLDWRSVGSLGNPSIHTFENDTGPDDANHAEKGICIMASLDGGGPQGKREGLSIYDITPTLLDLFGLPVPSQLRGRPIRQEVPARLGGEA